MEGEKEPMGLSPMIMAKRKLTPLRNDWCPEKPSRDDDPSDANDPKTITFKDISKAHMVLKNDLPPTILMKSHKHGWGIDVHFKLEIMYPSRNYNERGALYSLLRLTEAQRETGVVTASHGNFAMALAYHGNKLGISVAIVLPEGTKQNLVDKCVDYGAMVMLRGKNIIEARTQAHNIFCTRGFFYINGYDHPHVIAGSGVIAIEVLRQLPETAAILVPVGGGGLLAGICVAAKHIKPDILVYGVEPRECCSFYKAMQCGYPVKTLVGNSMAAQLGIPRVGSNAFHNAKSLVDKLILVDEDAISKAVMQLAECQKLVVDATGATSLAALLCIPNQLPELMGKTVVCLITSSSFVDIFPFIRNMSRSLALEGRLIKFKIRLEYENSTECTKNQTKLLRIIAAVGAGFIKCRYHLLHPHDLQMEITCIVKDLQHSCKVKHVVDKYFPGKVTYAEHPFSAVPICFCHPKREF